MMSGIATSMAHRCLVKHGTQIQTTNLADACVAALGIWMCFDYDRHSEVTTMVN